LHFALNQPVIRQVAGDPMLNATCSMQNDKWRAREARALCWEKFLEPAENRAVFLPERRARQDIARCCGF
jgi:hypothetical protein